jgi:AraC-like DNA-binding protein
VTWKTEGVLNERDIYREWAPPPAWALAVSCCWEQQVAGPRTQRVVPDGHADLLFFEDGPVEVVGLHDVVSLPHLPAGTRIRGVRLRPEAVAGAFGVPARSLRNLSVAAEDVFGQRDAAALNDPSVLDRWLRSITPDRRVAATVRMLASRTVAETADAVGVSRRQLGRLVVEHVGLPPKVFQRVTRFHRFVVAVDRGATLAAAAAEAGFADQAHMTRDVREFTSVTPARLAAERVG